jgi:acetyltransferase-like isoleucine patch superfamily enzyme
VGSLPRVQGKALIRNFGRVEIGERVCLRGSHVPVELASLHGGYLKLGDRCFVNSGASICASQSIVIGDNCLIGNYSLIMDTDFHDLYDRRLPGASAPVVIEDDVWIAAHVTVLKGVTIGRGAVVAAGSVVVSDIPPMTLYGGVPAKFIKSLEREPAAASPGDPR